MNKLWKTTWWCSNRQWPVQLSPRLWLRPTSTLLQGSPVLKLPKRARRVHHRNPPGLWLSSRLKRTKRLRLMTCSNSHTSSTTKSTWRITKWDKRLLSSKTASTRSLKHLTGRNRSRQSGTRLMKKRMRRGPPAESLTPTQEALSPTVSIIYSVQPITAASVCITQCMMLTLAISFFSSESHASNASKASYTS